MPVEIRHQDPSPQATQKIKSISWPRRLPPFFVAVTIFWLLITSILFFVIRTLESERLRADFGQEVEAHAALLRTVTNSAIGDVEGLAHFVQAQGGVDLAHFSAYTRSKLAQNHLPTLFAWAPKVNDAQRMDFELGAIASGLDDFVIRDIATRESSDRQSEYFAIRFGEPKESVASFLGWNLKSEPMRLEALEMARDTGKTSVTPPVLLVRGNTGLAIFVPVYDGGAVPETQELRRQKLLGFAFGAIQGDTLASFVRTSTADRDVSVEIRDANGQLLHRDAGFQVGNPLSLSRALQVANRHWVLSYAPAPVMLARHTRTMSWGALVMGLLLTTAFAYIAWQHQRRQNRVEQEVVARTRMLRASESRFSMLFASATEGILLLDEKTGAVQDANPAICRMLGYDLADMLSLHESDLHPPENPTSIRDHCDSEADTHNLAIHELNFRCSDGTDFVADINCSSMQVEGQSWIAVMISDASERIEARRILEEGVKQRTHELAMSEARSRAMLHTMLDGMVHIDPHGTMLRVNSAICNLFGYEEEELVGQNVSMLMPEPHAAAHDGYLRRYVQTREVHIIGKQRELQGRRKDGSLFPMNLAVNEMIDDDGNTFLGVIHDLSLAKQADAQLDIQRRQIEIVNRAQVQFIAGGDPIAFFEGMLPDILALTESEFGLIGEVMHDAKGAPYLKAYALSNIAWDEDTRKFYTEHAPEGLEFHKLDTLFGHVIRTGEPVISNDPTHDPRRGGVPAGHPQLHTFLGVPIFLGERLLGVICVANRLRGYNPNVMALLSPVLATCAQLFDAMNKDHERKTITQALQQQSSQLVRQAAEERTLGELLRHSMQDTGLKEYLDNILTKLIGNIPWLHLKPMGAVFLTVDKGAGRSLHLTAEYNLPEELHSLCARVPFGKCLCGRAAVERSIQFAHCVDERHDIRFEGMAPHGHYSVPLLQGDAILGVIVLYLAHGHVESEQELVFLRQVGEIVAMGINRRYLNRALIESKELAEAAALAKSSFLANMSHEIRTPINAMLGFSHLCLRTQLDRKQNEYLNKIQVSAESLLGIVNDILDFSKIEAGKLELEAIPFGLDKVLQQVVTLFGAKTRDNGVELVVATAPSVPNLLLGDPTRLGQVLTNLVSNAVKFTERGEIGVLVEMVSVSPEQVTLRFIVHDTGLGMSQEQISALFMPFMQADSSTTRKYGGTGLGLAISKQLVECMGGEIGVKSEQGAGSSFFFTASFGVSAQGEELKLAPRFSLDGKRILVVDDNAIMRTMLSKTLEDFSCKAVSLDSGEGALLKLREDANFDAVLMDWRLSGMDGVMAARRMREAGITIPVVLITGDETEIARDQAKIGDIQAFLSKPINRSTLHDTLAGVLGGVAVPASKKIQETPLPDLDSRNILLVDDNDFNRQVARELIEITGAHVDTAEDGKQALEAAAAKSYDLVLMDLQMPVMDGYAAARIIRQRFPDLPILALTAHAMIDERQRVLDAGMNDLLTKPILPQALYDGLCNWLGEQKPAPVARPGSGPESVIASDGPSAATCPTTQIPPEESWLDVAAGLVTANDNSNFYLRMLQMFRASPSIDTSTLRKLVAAGDTETAIRQAHTLKGMAGSIGAKPLQQTAAALESSLKGNAGDAEALLDGTEQILVATLSAIEKHEEANC